MTPEASNYKKRDIVQLDRDGNHYCRHVSAMTREGLHSKSDIAAELGYRDREIAKLKLLLLDISKSESRGVDFAEIIQATLEQPNDN